MNRRKSVMRVLLSSLLMTGLLVLTSCEEYSWAKEEVPEDLIVSFSANIFPFCNGCHGSWSADRTYDKLSANVNTNTPASSRILSIHSSITAFGSQMLQVDTLLLPAPDVIKIWASQGAEKN